MRNSNFLLPRHWCTSDLQTQGVGTWTATDAEVQQQQCREAVEVGVWVLQRLTACPRQRHLQIFACGKAQWYSHSPTVSESVTVQLFQSQSQSSCVRVSHSPVVSESQSSCVRAIAKQCQSHSPAVSGSQSNSVRVTVQQCQSHSPTVSESQSNGVRVTVQQCQTHSSTVRVTVQQ